MKHLELHIIQSFPVSCLNRDELGIPKTAFFGGVQRARVSSQSWKRSIRELAFCESETSKYYQGRRSRLFIDEIINEMLELGEPKDSAIALSLCAGHYIANLDSKQSGKVKTLVFLSPMEIKKTAELMMALSEENKNKLITAISGMNLEELEKEGDDSEGIEQDELQTEQGKKKVKGKSMSAKKFKELVKKILGSVIQKSLGKEQFKDAADIALFGRMVANDHSLTVEAASMFSHALSTHKVDNEVEFFSAVDDLQKSEESGAGMMGTLDFNSATYYRFAALNLDMLSDEDHLGCLSVDERKEIVKTFVESTIKAIPGARKNTMNSNTMPLFVLAIVREKGHPVQLVNAFENPLRSNCGYGIKSVELLKQYYNEIKETWGMVSVYEQSVPEITINKLLEEIAEHVC